MPELIFGPARPLIETIRSVANEHAGGRLRIAVAWARDDGVISLAHAISDRIQDLQILVGVNERGTTVEALLRLLPIASSLVVFYKHPRQTFHPKLYWFEDPVNNPTNSTLIVGSSNLTRGGLFTNFEASLIVQLRQQADAQSLDSIRNSWNDLHAGPYSVRMDSVARIQELYEAGHLTTERTVRRRRRLALERAGQRSGLLTAPPPRAIVPAAPPIVIPFAVRPEPPETRAEEADPVGVRPLRDRFFVRTLTANDVSKLHNVTPGTFEPDLGRTARDRYPGFWGWPDRYEQVIRRLPRQEWKARAVLTSRVRPNGIPITATLWYREERPGHAAEHRLGLGPIPDVRSAVPDDFDAASLMVMERCHDRPDRDFLIRFITFQDPGYRDFESYLTETRPEHRYGYGP